MRIAIIGGGINGLYLGWKLSEKNHQVTVFERKKQIGDKVVCSGLFSQRIVDFIPQSQKLIKNRINHVLIHFPKKTIRVNFSKDFFVIDHGQLDQLTADLAQKSGAKLLLNQSINAMPKGFDRIIGCDGANSFIRRNLALSDPKYKLGVLEFINKKDSGDYVEVWPDKTGFSWKIPRGENIEQGSIKELSSFSRSLAPSEKAKVIPQGLIIPNHDSITLSGDAAGLTKPWSGGGVIWGLLGADILLKTFPDFKKYRRRVKRFFIPKIILSKTGISLVYFAGFKTPWLMPKKARIESDFLL